MYFFGIVLAGVVATVVCDLWQVLLGRTTGLPVTNWGIVGRWVGYWPRGVFGHRPIAQSRPIRFENAIGWSFHYFVGIAYAAIFVPAFTASGWPVELLPVAALLFGGVTVVFPWFMMQPAFGLGVMAVKADRPGRIRVVNISTHLAFGFGLFLGTLIALFLA